MKPQLRGIFCISLIVGTAAPSEATICKLLLDPLLSKIEDCPAVRKHKAEHRKKKAEKKMSVKKHHVCDCLKSLFSHDCGCEDEGGCGCENCGE